MGEYRPGQLIGGRLPCGVLIMALLWPAPGVSATLDDRQILLLNVVVNGHSHDNILEITEQRGTLWLSRDRFAQAGLILDAHYSGGGDGLIALNTIKGWTWQLDAASQTLYLRVPVSDQIAQRLSADAPADDDIALRSDRGAVLNYDVQMTDYNGQNSNSLLGDLRMFGEDGLLTNRAVQTHNPYLDQTVRLDSVYSFSDVAHLRTVNVGDYITSGLSWTRPVRMAGVQTTTNFGLRPDLVTFPRPGIGGEVAVPSSVDIYVNGLHQMTRAVDAGPFDISALPVTSGGGDVSMVLTDANGRKTTQTLPFYTSNTLLSRGLDSLALEAGAVRRRYASRSADYAGAAVSASYRRGMLDRLTLETHLEASQDIVMGGMGANVLVNDLGVLSASLAASQFGARQGQQFGVGFAHTAQALSYGLSVLKADADFYDIAAAYGDNRPGTTLRASIGFPVPPGNGAFGLVYAHKLVNYYNSYTYASGPITTSTLSGTYSTPLPLLSAFGYLTLLHEFDYAAGNSLFIGISIPIGQRTTASISNSVSNGSGSQTLQMQQSAIERGEIGWKLAGQQGEQRRQNGGLEYKTDWGLIGAEAEQQNSAQAFRASLRGALAAMDGHLFAANTIDDSFALVDTDGLPGITVLQENRPLGKTDSRGLMLIEDLRAYENNRLSINANDVPMDVTLSNAELEVRPRDRAGVIAKFPIHRSRGAILRLVDARRRPITLGSVATLIGTGSEAMVGYDGQTFFEDLAEHNQLKVRTADRPDCTLSFDYHPQAGALPEIGPLICDRGN